MKKRFLSLLCVLALCLGLLPVTALAAGEDKPGTLWVGQTQITADGYWKTNPDGTLTTEGANKDNYNVHYDGNGTLTLNNAKIQGRGYSGNPQPEDYGIYAAPTGNQSVSLTINLMGSNTVSGYCGICVETTTADNASLVIQLAENDPQGSLEAIGNKYNGITISSGSGNASLTINNAPVVAISKSPAPNSYHGVCIKTGNATAPALSLLVNGGSLTAQGESGYGIYFYMRYSTPDPSTSLTIQNNALVKATPSIVTSNNLSKPDTTAGSESGGIVFDGNSGTVYGDVTLQEDLEIKSDETLTIPEGSTLDTKGNLTNNGTIVNKGTLNGDLTGGTGTVVNAPAITDQPNNAIVTVGQTATFTVAASGENLSYQWQQKTTDSGSDWTNVGSATSSNTYTIDNTTTSMSGYQYRCVVSNSAGSVESAAATLTVTQPVTGVTLDPTELSLFTGGSETLTATVTPNDATNPNVTWSSDRSDVATVDNGVVTAVGEGEATITVTTADGGYTATCTVTVTDPVYKMTTDPTALDFGSVYTGYTQPAAKTVTITNDGNQTLTLTQPASTSSFIVGSLSTTSLAVNGTATFTVQPKAGLAVGTYNESIKVTGTNGVNLSIPVTFRVRQYISPPTKTPSLQAMDKIEAAKDGDTVEITLSTGNTKLDKEVFEELAGQDITLVVKLSGGVSWTVNGQDIPENATLTDLDMGVSMNTSTIPVNLINMVTGEKGAVQMTLAHDGEFGFTMTLTAPVGTENKGLWANLYHYNTTRKQMLFETAAQVDASGNVALKFSHASEYAIVLDTKSHELPFDDVNVGDWFQAAVEYVYRNGIMTGTSATTFEPGTTLSRAMVAQILYNLEGQPAVTEATTFTDSGTHWAAKAIAWAQETGVVSGYEDNTFRPNKAVTREELAQMLYNYAKVKDYDLTASGDLTAFPDGVEVSSWAETAMAWANGNKLINGHDDGTLEPGGDSTRAQAASILMNFDVNLAN